MKLYYAVLPLLALTACATSPVGDYIQPQGEDSAVLVIDNREIISEGRQVRILGLNTSGCVGYSYLTSDRFISGQRKQALTNRERYQVRIPVSEKVLLNVEEVIDQPHVEWTWYFSRGFTAEKGYRYELITTYYLAGSGSEKGNPAPAGLQKYVQDVGRKEKANQYVAVLVKTGPDGKSEYVQWENEKMPAEKSEGYCPSGVKR